MTNTFSDLLGRMSPKSRARAAVTRPWRHLVTASIWTDGVICTNMESNVHLKDACHALHRYYPFGPPRTARDP